MARGDVVAERAERVGDAGEVALHTSPSADEPHAQSEGDGGEVVRQGRVRVGVEEGRGDALLLRGAVGARHVEAVRVGAVEVERAERVGAAAVATDQLEVVGKEAAGQRGRLAVGVGAEDGLPRVVPPEVGLQLVLDIERRGVGRQRDVAGEGVPAT